MTKPRDPKTFRRCDCDCHDDGGKCYHCFVARCWELPAEWQEAVNAAHVMRMIADCEMYGLITGPEVNVERCDAILETGAKLGYHPDPGILEKTSPA